MDEQEQITPAQRYDILALRFEGYDSAGRAFHQVSDAAEPLGYRVLAMIVAQVGQDGLPKIEDAGGTGLGVALHATAEGALGELGGPTGLLTWAVAGPPEAPGGRPPVDMAQRRAFQNSLKPDSSAILVLAETTVGPELTMRLAETGATAVNLPLAPEMSADIAHALMASNDIGQWDRPPAAGGTARDTL
jgi:hypothetical protein